MDLLSDTWTKKFGVNTTREHDPLDALYGYDTMWLAALAMNLAETRLQNMTPSLTLGKFQYTGNDSRIIKEAIYNSSLKVAFTGASVSVGTCTPCEQNHLIPLYTYMSTKYTSYILQGYIKLLPNGDRAPELRYFQYRINSSSEGNFQMQQANSTDHSMKYNISANLLRQIKIGELDNYNNLIIMPEAIPIFAGKPSTI